MKVLVKNENFKQDSLNNPPMILKSYKDLKENEKVIDFDRTIIPNVKLGKLSIKKEPAGKARVFAMVDI
jgi:hypothetical protein